jgi:hypothetical protein
MRGDFDEDEIEDDDYAWGDCDDDADPKCPECGIDLYTEEHLWDCGYAGDDDEDED